MSEQNSRASVVILGASFLFFPLLLCGLALVLYGHVTNGAFVRFGNSLLTSYTIASFVLLFSLFVYGDKRKRPISPLVGMLGAALVGVMVSFMFLSQGDMLMESNGSIRAQALSNIIRFSTTFIAISISALIVGGISFASLMNSSTKQHIFDEEE